MTKKKAKKGKKVKTEKKATKPADKKEKKAKKASPYGTALSLMCKKPDMSKDKLVAQMEKKGFDGAASAVGTAFSCVRSIVAKLRANDLMED